MKCKCGNEIKIDPFAYAEDIYRDVCTNEIICYECYHGITPWKTEVRRLEKTIDKLIERIRDLEVELNKKEEQFSMKKYRIIKTDTIYKIQGKRLFRWVTYGTLVERKNWTPQSMCDPYRHVPSKFNSLEEARLELNKIIERECNKKPKPATKVVYQVNVDDNVQNIIIE